MKKSAQGMVRRTRGRGTGGDGNNVLSGDAGDDQVYGGTGNDALFGGEVGMRFLAAANDGVFEGRRVACFS